VQKIFFIRLHYKERLFKTVTRPAVSAKYSENQCWHGFPQIIMPGKQQRNNCFLAKPYRLLISGI
jgi:hypothetical protein